MTFTLDKYMPYTVGFDRFFDTLDIVSNTDVKGYPHYNIKKIDDGEWKIDFALAGFSKKDININVKENKMTVDGEIESNNEDYLYKGISTKKFSKTFSLAEYTEPTDATMENGILTITLKQELPEEKKPKTIKIKQCQHILIEIRRLEKSGMSIYRMMIGPSHYEIKMQRW